MLIRTLATCSAFCAADRTVLRELLHPARQPVAIRYSLAHAEVASGSASVPHRLRTAEVYYIISGRGRMHIDRQSRPLAADQCVYIPPGALQYIENTGDDVLRFLCIVDPAWRAEDEQVPG